MIKPGGPMRLSCSQARPRPSGAAEEEEGSVVSMAGFYAARAAAIGEMVIIYMNENNSH